MGHENSPVTDVLNGLNPIIVSVKVVEMVAASCEVTGKGRDQDRFLPQVGKKFSCVFQPVKKFFVTDLKHLAFNVVRSTRDYF